MPRPPFKSQMLLALLLCVGSAALAQSRPLDVSGKITVNGRDVPYTIRHLPPSSFPALPPAVLAVLDSRGCLIPQTYEAHQPENVVHGSLQRAGSSDWAVLCSVNGNASLLVFFGSSPMQQPSVLASAPETERLSRDTVTGVYGFNWAIDPATPERIREAEDGMQPRPPLPDHDALADSVIDHRTIYHFYANNSWTLLDLPER